MSWDAYCNQYITSKAPAFTNMCQQGYIIGIDGTQWGKSTTAPAFRDKAEAAKWAECMGNTTPALTINGEKYNIIQRSSNSLYLKKAGGGAVIAKSGKSFCVGIWEQKYKGKKKVGDGPEKEVNQNPGDCATLVEGCRDYLEGLGY